MPAPILIVGGGIAGLTAALGLRARGIVRRPEDLGIETLDADRSLLAARSIKDLVHWSGGLYEPPARFRNW